MQAACMKTKMTMRFTQMTDIADYRYSPKLVSLLALAAGAAALPQTGHADIIYNDLSSNPAVVGFGGASSFEFALPGKARFGFTRRSTVSSTLTATVPVTFRTVIAGDLGGRAGAGIRGGEDGFAAAAAAGAAWSQGQFTWRYVTVGIASNGGHTPTGDYDKQYLAWTFTDSTPGGGNRYGWVEVSLNVNNVVSGNPTSGPKVTIWGYAYDNTGAKPNLGQVPEPTSLSLLVFGALALGARGMRSWRRERDAAGTS